MTDEQMFFMGATYQVVTYFVRLMQLVGFILAVFIAKKENNKPIKGLALFLGSEFILWLINQILLYDAPQEGVTEYMYYNTFTAIVRVLVLNYLFSFALNLPKNTKKVLTIFALFTVFLNIVDSIIRGNETILEYVIYSQYLNDLFIIIVSLTYIVHSLNSEGLRKMKYVPISILFFSYFSIHLIYTSSTNFILNQAFKNDLVLIVMLSQIIFDFVFNCLLFIFIIKKFLKNAKN